MERWNSQKFKRVLNFVETIFLKENLVCRLQSNNKSFYCESNRIKKCGDAPAAAAREQYRRRRLALLDKFLARMPILRAFPTQPSDRPLALLSLLSQYARDAPAHLDDFYLSPPPPSLLNRQNVFGTLGDLAMNFHFHQLDAHKTSNCPPQGAIIKLYNLCKFLQPKILKCCICDAFKLPAISCSGIFITLS